MAPVVVMGLSYRDYHGRLVTGSIESGMHCPLEPLDRLLILAWTMRLLLSLRVRISSDHSPLVPVSPKKVMNIRALHMVLPMRVKVKRLWRMFSPRHSNTYL
jgi:hypothetical protein